MVLPDALLLTELFLCPLQCLARPHLIDVLGALCRIHYNGHTVVGHLTMPSPTTAWCQSVS